MDEKSRVGNVVCLRIHALENLCFKLIVNCFPFMSIIIYIYCQPSTVENIPCTVVRPHLLFVVNYIDCQKSLTEMT